MEEQITYKIPAGYEFDADKSTVGELVLKKIHQTPSIKKWEDYMAATNGKECYTLNSNGAVFSMLRNSYSFYNSFDTKEEAEACAAFCKLIQLRDYWIGDWKPNWKNKKEKKWCIKISKNTPVVDISFTYNCVLAFPTEEMRNEFYETFGELIIKASIFL